MRSSSPSIDWCLSGAYGFSESKRNFVLDRPGFRETFDYEGESSSIPLFKMHGSINWVFKHAKSYPPADLVSGSNRELLVIRNQKIPESRVQVRTRGKGRPWYTSPVIVPPVYEKHGLIRRLLPGVWEGASEAIKNADRIMFWGYSFPAADIHARHFFQSMVNVNPVLKTPVLINPDPQSAVALWSVIQPTSVTHYRSAEEFLRTQ
ncbi:MAG: hypothetical protein ACRDKI_05855 [Solirubrobacterales bacterium]